MAKNIIFSCLVLLVTSATCVQAQSQPSALPQQGELGWVKLNTGMDVDFERILMFGPDTAWAIAQGGFAAFTSDAGQSWRKVQTVGYHIKTFTTPLVGFAAVGNKLIKTTDGGFTWSEPRPIPIADPTIHNVGPDSLFALQIAEADHVFARSTDGGETWQNLPQSVRRPRAMHMANAQFGMIVGDTRMIPEPPYPWWGQMDATLDGGKTWVEFRTRISRDLYGVFALDQYNFFFITGGGGGQQFIRTSNAGKSWDSVAFRYDAFYKMYFHDSQRGFIVGVKGAIVRTQDGGRAWERQKSRVQMGVDTPEDVTLKDILFVDDSIGMVVGSHSTVLRTTSAGRSWVNLSPPPPVFDVRSKQAERHLMLTFELPKISMVVIELLDANGRNVVQNWQAIKPAGQGTAVLDIENLPSGAYLYRLSALGQIATGKFTIVR